VHQWLNPLSKFVDLPLKGVQTMKSEMQTSLKTRFSDVVKNECLVIVTLLNPHFKDNFSVVLAKELLLDNC